MNTKKTNYTLTANQEISIGSMVGDYTVEFRLENLMGEGAYKLGLRMDNTVDGMPLRFALLEDHFFLLLHGDDGKMLIRIFPNLGPKENPLTVRVDVYPARQLIRYYFNGKLYGERQLSHPTDPILTDGKLSLFTEGEVQADFCDFTCRPAEAPHREYIIPTEPWEPRDFETLFPRSETPANEIFLIQMDGLSLEDYMTAVTLQGLVNRTSPRLYVHSGKYNDRFAPGHSTEWYKLLEEKGRKITECSLDEALIRFSDCYRGFVLGTLRPEGNTSFEMNMVTMLAGVEDSVYVSRDRSVLMDATLPRIDIDGRWASDIEAYTWARDHLWPQCHPAMLCHMYGDCDLHFTEPCRDYLVQHKIFVFNSSDVTDEDDYYFYFDLLALTPPNTPVLGIACRNGESLHDGVLDEDSLFRACAELGKYFVYTFSVDNASVMSGLEHDPLHQKPYEPITYDRDKTYVSFLLSEGENYAWAYHLWGSSYCHPSREGVHKGWSNAGAMYFLAPAVLEWYYKNASPWDAWYLDGNGIGDIYNPDIFGLRLPKELRQTAWKEYLALTREVMRRMDISVIRLFDANYSVMDEAIREYLQAIPEITAVFTGYNSEPDADKFAAPQYLLDGVPVFRTRVTSQTPTYKPEVDGQVLLDGILREMKKDGGPTFINVFVLGNYMLVNGSMVLHYVQDHLPENCVVVRPEQLADVFRQQQEQIG